MDNRSESFDRARDDERKKRLFLMQKSTLDTFLQNGAISREQYDFSYNGLITKMNVTQNELADWTRT
jgi:hypothetical protein